MGTNGRVVGSRIQRQRIARGSASNRRLECRVKSLDYDFAARIGRLYLAHRQRCNQGAAIDLFLAIDPAVREIRVSCGDVGYRMVYMAEEDVWALMDAPEDGDYSRIDGRVPPDEKGV